MRKVIDRPTPAMLLLTSEATGVATEWTGVVMSTRVHLTVVRGRSSEIGAGPVSLQG